MSSKVFISHSEKDQEGFVNNFVEKLIKRGIDVWYFPKNIKNGNNFVKKIYEGLNSCNYFILIISKNSNDSKWVDHEVEFAIDKQIKEMMLILPVRIDIDADRPLYFSTIQVLDIENWEDYERELNSIVEIINKENISESIQDLKVFQKYDDKLIFILKELGKKVYLEETYDLIDYFILKNSFETFFNIKISNKKFVDNLSKLKEDNLLNFGPYAGSFTPTYVELTPIGFYEYLCFLEDFEEIQRKIISFILNEYSKKESDYEICTNQEIHDSTKISLIIINSFLSFFKFEEYLSFDICLGNEISIIDISYIGKNYFKSIIK